MEIYKKGFVIMVTLSSDKALVHEIKAKLKDNNNYCPCQLIKSPDTRCMCKSFRDMISGGQEGTCHCGLYVFTKD